MANLVAWNSLGLRAKLLIAFLLAGLPPFAVADLLKEKCIGVMLSGSGIDGAEGLEEVVRMGGVAITQDQSTSLCKTMPVTAHERAKGSIYVADKDIAETIHKIHSMNVSATTISELTG